MARRRQALGMVFGVIAWAPAWAAAMVVHGKVLEGAHGIAGEWGHNPLPGDERRRNWDEARACYCGKRGCIETWSVVGVEGSGSGFFAPCRAQER